MTVIFYLSAAVAVISTFMVITRKQPIHALLYLLLSLCAVAVCFLAIGAALVAFLEMIIYAGAILVLFVFVIMMLNPEPRELDRTSNSTPSFFWAGPSLFALILIGELIYILFFTNLPANNETVAITAQHVGFSLFETYFLGVELASLLLLSGLVGAYHLGKRDLPDEAEGGTK